jgi:type I restriction enzyme S subunit
MSNFDKLGNVANGYGGSGFPEYLQGNINDDIPFIKVSDFNLTENVKYIVKANNYVSKELAENNKFRIFPKNTIVIAKVGAAVYLNRKRILKQDTIIDNNLMGIIPKIDVEFLYQSLLHIDLTEKVQQGALPSLTFNLLSDINLFVPDLPTQKRIAKILSTVDGQIEKTEAIIAKYQAIKQGMLHDLFTRGIDLATGKLRPIPEQSPELYKQSPLGLIPKDWDIEKMSECLEFIEQGWSPNCDDIPAVENKWGVLKTTAVTWSGYDQKQNKVLPDSLTPKYQYEISINDVLVTRAGPNSRVGVVAYVNKTRNKLIFSDKIYRITPIKSKLTNHFLYLALSSNHSQMELSRYKTGMAESQTNISQAIILKLTVIHPEINEQELISNKVNKINMLISSESAYLIKLQKLKQGLMSKLLNGDV